MPQRLAAILALLVFAACLVIGGLEVQNSFGTTVLRGLGAMGVTYVIGLVIGAMAQKMLEENLKPLTKEAVEMKELNQKKPAADR